MVPRLQSVVAQGLASRAAAPPAMLTTPRRCHAAAGVSDMWHCRAARVKCSGRVCGMLCGALIPGLHQLAAAGAISSGLHLFAYTEGHNTE